MISPSLISPSLPSPSLPSPSLPSPSTLRFENQVVLVTGAASGIGRATAHAFAGSGAALVLSDIDVSGCATLIEELAPTGASMLAVECDVGQERDVAAMVAEAVRRFGKLDAAFNCAGVEGAHASLIDTSEEDWDRTMAVNLKGTWLCMKHELRQMQVQPNGGAIVNCSSIAGTRGLEGAAAYSASKHGILGLTKTGAIESVRHGVRVNAICPGFVETPMLTRQFESASMVRRKVKRMIDNTPLGRPAFAHEVAAVVLWLCSPEASFVTGQGIHVDAGSSA